MTTYLKVLGPNLQAVHGGNFDYTDYLPQGDQPGAWLPAREPKLCWSGWHWCTPDSLMQHWATPNMRVYEVEPFAEVTRLTQDGKCVSSSGRLLREYPLPEWWTNAMQFIQEELPNVPWMQRVGPVDPAWRVFPTLDSAWVGGQDAARDMAYGAVAIAAKDAARGSARAAVRDAAWPVVIGTTTDDLSARWTAADDAILYTVVRYLCADLPLVQEHRDHAAARWEVWKRGYGVACDVDGVLHVYEKVV